MKFPTITTYDTWGDEVNKKIESILNKNREVSQYAKNTFENRVIENQKEYVYNSNLNKISSILAAGVTGYIPSGFFLFTDTSGCGYDYTTSQIREYCRLDYVISENHTKELIGQQPTLRVTCSDGLTISVSFPGSTTPKTEITSSAGVGGINKISVVVPSDASTIVLSVENKTASAKGLADIKYNTSSSDTAILSSANSQNIGEFVFSYSQEPQQNRIKIDGSTVKLTEYPLLVSEFQSSSQGLSSSYPDLTMPNIFASGKLGAFLKYNSNVGITQGTLYSSSMLDHKHISPAHNHTLASDVISGANVTAAGATLAGVYNGSETTIVESVSVTLGEAEVNTGGGASIRVANETRFKNISLGLFVVAQ